MLGLDQGTLFGLVKKLGTTQSLLCQIHGLKAPSGGASLGAVVPSPPQDFYCPTTYEVVRDPVVAAGGITSEQSEIEQWLQNNDRSPMTKAMLPDRSLVPNQVLKHQIMAFFDKYSMPRLPIERRAAQQQLLLLRSCIFLHVFSAETGAERLRNAFLLVLCTTCVLRDDREDCCALRPRHRCESGVPDGVSASQWPFHASEEWYGFRTGGRNIDGVTMQIQHIH